MESVPMPQVLDADRLVLPDRDALTNDDYAQRIDLLRTELHRTCDYGRSLWQLLYAVREYLVDSLPDAPDADGIRVRTTTAPTGPSDDEGWHNWMRIYAAVTSSLAGVRGDAGLGSEEAQLIAQHRRATRG